jgi:SAM-dependent methyltransferase
MNETPDFEAATKTQQALWAKGDFSVIANIVFNASETLVEALQVIPGERVLDVACGSGNASLAAARRAWGNTTGCDFVPALLERARERAAAERLEIEFVEADAQALPFADGEFDVVTSVYGAMFAPDHEKTAAELLRVTRPGGRIGMANWCPDGGLEGLFGAIVKHTGGPPPGAVPPVLWGSEEHVRDLLGDAARARPSSRPTTTSSSSAPTSGRSRPLSSRSAARARRRLPPTCGSGWKARTSPARRRS